ncbi:DUF4402 domain-containing protein (plasmid) [Pseudoalteromonas xiamenensis]|uniref:DUF4402 domain-containing protein n=1 Tax=Pseudoalteromonas xiamenensis TaxID=882626 RepID=UPI0027E518A7|nr:DUF4402 domain-containing protein [Pseudoalteromonas xiamenensis]WMN61922.1 DUF4402 domain-containing protein [Pseudoalteromonas xiamenensis]
MNKTSALLAATAMGALSLAAHASTKTAQLAVSVKVKNTFTLEQGEPMSFGSLLAFADTSTTVDNQATIVMSPNPSTQPTLTSAGEAKFQVLESGTPGSFNVSGTAPYSSMLITAPASIEVTPTTAPPSAPKFTLSDFKFFIDGGENTGKAYDAATTPLISDVSGAVKFYVGGTLKTQARATQSMYQDGDYSGSVDVTVTYK